MSVCMQTGVLAETEAFAARLRRLREDAGISRCGLARLARCSETEVRHLESGRTEWPSVLLGVRLARALRVSVEYLALGEERPS
jgi:transcriptional regulator with XRE-family HTH domain